MVTDPTHIQTHVQTHRQDRVQYTAPQLVRSVKERKKERHQKQSQKMLWPFPITLARGLLYNRLYYRTSRKVYDYYQIPYSSVATVQYLLSHSRYFVYRAALRSSLRLINVCNALRRVNAGERTFLRAFLSFRRLVANVCLCALHKNCASVCCISRYVHACEAFKGLLLAMIAIGVPVGHPRLRA